jgi:hypothetical protein
MKINITPQIFKSVGNLDKRASLNYVLVILGGGGYMRLGCGEWLCVFLKFYCRYALTQGWSIKYK